MTKTLAPGPPQAITKQKIKKRVRHGDAELHNAATLQCRRKFLRFFPNGFADEKYIAWERQYKWEAHQRWQDELSHERYRELLIKGRYIEIADRAVAIEARTNLLFSFEKMAIRDAVRSIAGACTFATGLYHFLFDTESVAERFEHWHEAVAKLPRKQTRVATWPVTTVFPFIAIPKEHVFLKPNVTRTAAQEYQFPFVYKPKLSWDTYSSLLQFAEAIGKDQSDLAPKDMIDIQSFIWTVGSDEYAE